MRFSGFQERALRLAFLFLVGYGVALVLLRGFESHFLFFPNYPDRMAGDWNPRGIRAEDVSLTSSDGTKLHAWWIQADGARFTFVAFHGNAGNITDRAEVYRFLNQLPVNVLALEYRGYGKSEGSPNESGLYRDAEAAFNYLVGPKNIPPGMIIGYGQSLGTAVAAHLAARHSLAGVILEAPFPSAASVARERLWFFPGLPLLLWGQLNTQKAIQDIHAPILIVHCVDDPVIPFSLGKTVYEKANQPKSFLSVPGQCHEEASLIAPGLHREAIRRFLAGI